MKIAVKEKNLGIFIMNLALGVGLTACSSMDKTPNADIKYAPVWEYAVQTKGAKVVEKEWWGSFGSTQLTQLVDTAQQKNPDVVIASERVKQAELQMKIANASLFPFFSLSASSGEKRSRADVGEWANSGSTTAGVSASYELDLWGGEMASRRVAKSSYRATAFDNEATRLSISAGIAIAWFNYLALQERVATARKNIEIAERIQRIVDSLYRNGASTAADVAVQRTNLLSQQNALLPLQLQLDQTRAAIALLQGEVPQAYQLANEKFSDLKIPVLAVGVPADIVTRRPDVASVEAQFHASSAQVHQARTALLPGIQLSGNFGKSTSELFSLNPALQTRGWSLSLVQTIFAGGKLANQVRIGESRRVEVLEQYRKVVLVALQETDDAINRVNVSQQQEINQTTILEQAARSLRLNEDRYREGSVDLQTLLDSQRSYFQAQDALVQQRLARLRATVDLYRALGGGWEKE